MVIKTTFQETPMNGDKSDEKKVTPPASVTQARPIIDHDRMAERTVILRLRKSSDIGRVVSDINSAGAIVVSEGAGGVVIKGSAQAIDHLRGHENIIAIEEPKHLEMKRSTGARRNKGPKEGL